MPPNLKVNFDLLREPFNASPTLFPIVRPPCDVYFLQVDHIFGICSMVSHHKHVNCAAKLGVLTILVYIYVVVQFYPLFKFSFLLFLGMVMYDNNMIMSLTQKKRKFEPRIKSNHNIHTPTASC